MKDLKLKIAALVAIVIACAAPIYMGLLVAITLYAFSVYSILTSNSDEYDHGINVAVFNDSHYNTRSFNDYLFAIFAAIPVSIGLVVHWLSELLQRYARYIAIILVAALFIIGIVQLIS